MLSEPPDWPTRSSSTKRPRLRCTAWCEKSLRRKRLRSTQDPHMVRMFLHFIRGWLKDCSLLKKKHTHIQNVIFRVAWPPRCDVFTHPISVRLLGKTDERPICTEILCTLIHYNIGGNIANNLNFVMYVWPRLNGLFCEATHTDTSLLDLGYHLPVAWFYGVFTLPDTDTDTDKNGFNYNMQNYSHWPTPTQTPILSVSVSVNTPLKSGWVVSLLAGELLRRAVFLIFSYIWRYY